MRHIGGSPNVVNLVESFREASLAYMVMERCDMSFLQGLESLPELTERTLSGVFAQLLCGLAQVHAAGVVHRDVKPDNFLCTTEGVVKLCDFGLSARLGDPAGVRGEHGTLPFMAPEMLGREAYGAEVDVWSLGAIVYVLLFGKFPYMASTLRAMKAAIRSGEPAPDFRAKPGLLLLEEAASEPASEPESESCSGAALAFAQALLARSAGVRPSAGEALQHRFLSGEASSEAGEPSVSLRPMLEAAKHVGAFGAWQGQVAATMLDVKLAGLQEAAFGPTAWGEAVCTPVGAHLLAEGGVAGARKRSKTPSSNPSAWSSTTASTEVGSGDSLALSDSSF